MKTEPIYRRALFAAMYFGATTTAFAVAVIWLQFLYHPSYRCEQSTRHDGTELRILLTAPGKLSIEYDTAVGDERRDPCSFVQWNQHPPYHMLIEPIIPEISYKTWTRPLPLGRGSHLSIELSFFGVAFFGIMLTCWSWWLRKRRQHLDERHGFPVVPRGKSNGDSRRFPGALK
jgi:hypothetical protein